MNEKITIKESLDRVIYPILTLPVEVTSEIFLHCLPVKPGQPDGRVAPMLLGQICQKWRNIAYSNPRLWAALGIDFWGWIGGLNFLVREWLRRAGSVPLSLRLVLPNPHCTGSFFFQRCGCPSSSAFTDHWRNLTSFCGDNFTPAECLKLLSLAPKLVRCEFNRISDGFLRSPPTTQLLLTDLQDLTLNTYGDFDTNLLLDSLTLPAFRSLSLPSIFRRFNDTLFLSFIKRASVIQSFSAGFSALSLPDGSMTAILGAMPTLTSLDLRLDTQAAIIFDILRLLNESTTFLPHLRKLHLTLFSMSWKDHFTAIFVDALTSRWEAKSGIAQLVDFDLRLLPLVELDGKVLDCISKLKDKGMRIEVGPWTR
jgi:hypothetical protein